MRSERPDLVTDSELETTLSQHGTTHAFHRYIHGRQHVSRHEHWIREKPLGRGAFATVWLETCTRGENEGDLRAVKEIRKLTSPSRSVDYNRELEAIAKFSKPRYEGHFVQSFGWFETAEAVFIAMKYFRRGDLEMYLQDQRSTLYPREAQQITHQLLEGLNFMHSSGFAHRDIKPGNILLESCPPDTWWIKISDFGISKRVAGTNGVSTVNIGTPGYMAPELRRRRLSPTEDLIDYQAADMWALGQVAFRILHGEDACQELEACAQNNSEQIRYLSTKLMLSLGPSGLEFITKAMAVDAVSRLTASAALTHPWMADFGSKYKEKSLFSAPLLEALPDVASAKWSTLSGSTMVDSASRSNTSAEPKLVPGGEKTQSPERDGRPLSPSVDMAPLNPREIETPIDPTRKSLLPPLHLTDLVPREGWHTLFDNVDEEARLLAVEKVDLLISRGYAFPLPRQDDGSSMVHFAAKNGLINLINYLHSLGVDTKARCDDSSTAVHWAAKGGYLDMITHLPSLGLDIRAQCDDESTAVHWAALGGAIPVINHLRSVGMDLKAQDVTSKTALHWAAEGGHIDMVGHLCSLGLNLEAKISSGSTVLHRAAAGGKLAMVNYLCSLGFDPCEANKQDMNLVHFAAYSGSIPILDHICSFGLDVKSEGSGGWTAVHSAAAGGCINMMNHLQSLGLDIRAKTSNGMTPLHRAAIYGKIAMISHLYSLGLDVRGTGSGGITALHCAAYGGSIAMIDHLFSLGLDIKATDSSGGTLIHAAASGGKIAKMSHLRCLGLDVKAKDLKSRTAMHWAAYCGRIPMIDYLCSAGLEVDAKDANGRTPQGWASGNGKWKAAQHLSKIQKNQSASASRGLRRFFSKQGS